MDSCNSEEVLAALREASAAFDKFLCDLDAFICEEEEDLARYEAEYCYDSIENADQITKEDAHVNLEKHRSNLEEYHAIFERGIKPEDAAMLGALCLNLGVMLTDGAEDDKEQRRLGMDYFQFALDVYQFLARITSLNKYRELFYEVFDRLMPLAEEDGDEELLLQLEMKLLKFAKLVPSRIMRKLV